MIDQATRELRMKGRCDEAFQSWISQPLVRMTISKMPSGDDPDTMRELLRSAFDAGNGSGQGIMAAEMIEAILAKEDKKRA